MLESLWLTKMSVASHHHGMGSEVFWGGGGKLCHHLTAAACITEYYPA